jgi:hypothetical protein
LKGARVATLLSGTKVDLPARHASRGTPSPCLPFALQPTTPAAEEFGTPPGTAGGRPGSPDAVGGTVAGMEDSSIGDPTAAAATEPAPEPVAVEDPDAGALAEA